MAKIMDIVAKESKGKMGLDREIRCGNDVSASVLNPSFWRIIMVRK